MSNVFGKITSATMVGVDTEKPSFMLNVINPKDMSARKVFLSPKVAAHALLGKSDEEISGNQLKGKYISASYHAKGEILHDKSECSDDDTLINNSTVSFIDKEDAIELLNL